MVEKFRNPESELVYRRTEMMVRLSLHACAVWLRVFLLRVYKSLAKINYGGCKLEFEPIRLKKILLSIYITLKEFILHNGTV